MGALTNIATAYLISRVKIQTLSVVSGVVTVIAPILMATITVGENYWFTPFWALFLSPMNPDGQYPFPPPFSFILSQVIIFICPWQSRRPANDQEVLFTAANLAISETFPVDVQSLAGGVFNEVAQFGNSVGLAVTVAIAASVTEHSRRTDHKAALMKGYRTAFWTVFTSAALVVMISYFGFRRVGTVGKKDD